MLANLDNPHPIVPSYDHIFDQYNDKTIKIEKKA